MRNSTRWAAVAALLLIAPACGDDDDDDASTATTGGDAAGTVEEGTDVCAAPDSGEAVAIADFAFDPAAVSVAGGGVVTVSNEDSATHTFTSGDGGNFDCEVAGGETVNVLVDAAPGEYEFYCDIHPTMTGTITVT